MTEVVIKVIGNYSYQTSKCLGEGVYGKVYEGIQRETKQKVAIKKIDLATFTNDKYLQNAIFSEIYLLKRFNHPNIVKFKDVLSSKNSLYIITEFCKNGDLKQLIKRKKFKEEESFEIMYQIMSGFSELIREKIVHRDLKPANILINEGTYKIGDFGFAKYVDNFGSQMLKSCVGSPIYMAPQILERAQYSTKCDIWSVGIIFYQMQFGYPPWKARDQAELLRGIKTIPITHILKRNSNNLSTKAIQFLKRTLAYSQQERIGWGQLFEMFNTSSNSNSSNSKQQSSPSSNKIASLQQQMQKMFHQREAPFQQPNTPTAPITKQRSRQGGSTNTPTSWGTSGNTQTSHQNQSINNIKSSSNQSITNTTTASTKYGSLKNMTGGMGLGSLSSDRVSNTNSIVNPNISERRIANNTYGNSQQQMQNVIVWRQCCAFYHFYTVELYTNLQVIRHHLGSIEAYGQLILVLALMVKHKSTYCLSLISIHHKGNKNLEELYRRMKAEHDSYEMLYSQISAKLDAQNIGKTVRNEIYNHIGRSQAMNEEKNDKLENIMVKYANENAQIISDEVRKKVKTLREIKIVEILNYVLQVLSLGMGKQKALRQLKQAPRMQDQDLKDYISRVINKLDRLTTTSS